MNDDNSIRQLSSDILDGTLLREFQAGLSALLDITVSIYDKNAKLVVPTSKERGLCSAIKAHDDGKALCDHACQKAITLAIEKKKTYISRCHSNQYLFAIPVFIDHNFTYVIVGGRVYLSGNEVKDFYKGVERFNFDEPTLDMLLNEVKTISPKAVVTVPRVVNNLAVPFLKCLYTLCDTTHGGTAAELARNRTKGFSALEQVYKSIATVLDKEELYDTILAKSAELVEAERSSLMIIDNTGATLSMKSAKGIDSALFGDMSVKVGHGIAGRTAESGLPCMVRDISAEIRGHESKPKYKTKSFISIPLKLDNRVVGVINVSDKITGEVFSDEDMQLLLSFANYASIALDRGAYYSLNEELKKLSMTDSLTGIFNRRYFRERILEEAERVRRHNEFFSLFMIDIDDFKKFNDKYGHAAGDEIIKGVADAIRDCVRSMDIVARVGGEEFVVILPHTDKLAAKLIAERIRLSVGYFCEPIRGLNERPTVSIGVAEYPSDAGDTDELVHRADKAMYEGKRAGKDRVVVYES